MTIKNKKLLKFASVILAIASTFAITAPLSIYRGHPKQIISKGDENISLTNSKSSSKTVNSVTLDTNQYNVEMIKDQMISVPISTNNQFSLRNSTSGEKRFWQLSFSNGSVSHDAQLDFFDKEYQFDAANLISEEKVSLENYKTPNENIMTYVLYDKNMTETTSTVLSQGSYKEQNNKYGLDFTTDPSYFFEDKSLSDQYPIMYVGAKFWYENSDLKPIPVPDVGSNSSYIYDITDEHVWFSTGYFVYDSNQQNRLNYYVPQKTQDTSVEENTDFSVEIKGDIDKKLTAQQFYDINQNNLKEIITLKIKNGIPGISGTMSLDINSEQGLIDIFYTPNHIVTVEQTTNGAIIQSGFQENNTRIKVGTIDGFYTNTSKKGDVIPANIGNIGQSKLPGEVTTKDAVNRVSELINQIWDQPFSDMRVIEIKKEAIDNTQLLFTCRPNKVIKNGQIIDVTTDEYDVRVNFNSGFKQFTPTNIVGLPTPLNTNIIPRDLQWYFDEVKDDKELLKQRLLEFAEITGEENDVANVIINTIEVGQYDDNAGTAELRVNASNCIFGNSPNKVSHTFAVSLKNLKRIRETKWEDGTEFSWNYQEAEPFTVEKLIYDLYRNKETYDAFIEWIKTTLVHDSPRDATFTLENPEIEPGQSTTLYSNKEKYFYVKVSLDKHYASPNNDSQTQDIINESTSPFFKTFKINLTNATSVVTPTTITPSEITAFSDKYANEVTEAEIQQELFKYLNPSATNSDITDITKFPRVDNSGNTLTFENVQLRNVVKDNKNGTISFDYRLNAKYDETNYNTEWLTDDSEKDWKKLTITGLVTPNITKYDETSDKQIALTTVSEIYANNFSDNNDPNIIQAIKDKIKYGGNTEGVTLTYNISQNQILDNLYSGKLAIDVTIQNAWVYDAAIDSAPDRQDMYIKQENVDLGEFILTGFKQYTQTDFKADNEETQTKTINIRNYPNEWNDTTANNIDWSVENLQTFVLNNIDVFFDNPPINQDGSSYLTPDDIIINNLIYNAFDDQNHPIDNPTIQFKIGLKKFIVPVGSGFELQNGTKEFGTVTITGFRKSIATGVSLNNITGKINVISQLVTSENFKESINNFSGSYNITSNRPNNWSENDITVSIKPDTWNNKNGTLDVTYTFNNVYTDTGDNRFPVSSVSLDAHITNFKNVTPTTAANNKTINIPDFSNYIASELVESDIETIKDIIANNINSFLINAPTDFNSDNLIFDASNVVALNNNGSVGQITIKNFKVNKYFNDDEKYTLISPETVSGEKDFGEFTITGFKLVEETSLNTSLNNQITIDALNDKIAQDIKNNADVISQTIQNYIYDNRNTIFKNLPNSDQYQSSWISVECVQDSWNNKNGTIKVNIVLKQYYDASGSLITSTQNNPKIIQDVIISGFQQVTPTQMTTNTISVDGINQYFAQKNGTTVDNNVKGIIINTIANQSNLFNPLPVSNLSVNDIDIEVVPQSWNNMNGSLKVNISISKYYDDNSVGQTNGTSKKTFNDITISGFKQVSPTNVKETVVNNGIQTNINKYPDDPNILDDVKSYVVTNQSTIFENLPTDYLNKTALDATDFNITITNYNITTGEINVNIELSKYYKDDDKCSFTDSTTEQFASSIKLFVNQEYTYPASVIPNFGSKEFSDAIVDNSYNGVIGREMLVQDFYANLDNYKDTVKQTIVDAYNNEPNNKLKLTVNDIDFSFEQNSVNNSKGSIVLKDITFSPGKYITSDGKRPNVATTISINKEIVGFLKAEQTQLKSDNFNASNIASFFNEYGDKYAKMYPQQIFLDMGETIKQEFKTWIQNNPYSLFANNDGTENNELHINDDSNIAEVFDLTLNGFLNREGAIIFNLYIPNQYVYSGANALYGQEDLNVDFKLSIGMKVNGSTTINNSMNISTEEIRSKLPSQYVDSSKDVAEAAKNLILDKLYVEWKQNPQEFLNKNSLLENVPITWLGNLPDSASQEDFKNQFSPNIKVEYVRNNDKNGTVTFNISINDGSDYFKWGVDEENPLGSDDYILVKNTGSSVNNNATMVTVNGFQKFSEFPIWPIVLGITGLIVLIAIIILCLYYYHKKKKYTTVTVANENEMR